MPGIDRWEAVRRLKSDPQTRDIPIIGMSAHALDSERERPLPRGATSSTPNRSNSRVWSQPFGACLRTPNRTSDRVANPIQAQDGAPPGRRTVNTEPLPGSLATVTSPPIMRASLRVMARPKPGAAEALRGRGLGLAEFLEQLRLLLRASCRCRYRRRQARSSRGRCPLRASQRDLALLGELAGIAQEIEQDLPQPHGIDRQGAEVLLALQRPGGSCSARRAGARCRSPRRSAAQVRSSAG